MTSDYIIKLSLTTYKPGIGKYKINSLILKTYNIVLTSFLLQNSLEQVRFFEKTFLLADTSIKVVLECFFFLAMQTFSLR